MILCEVYPGIQSILTPADGTDQECITSRDDARICSLISTGNAIAPVACNRSMLLIPFRKGLLGFLYNSQFSPSFKRKLTLNKLKRLSLVKPNFV